VARKGNSRRINLRNTKPTLARRDWPFIVVHQIVAYLGEMTGNSGQLGAEEGAALPLVLCVLPRKRCQVKLQDKSILVVDDEPLLVLVMRDLFESEGASVCSSASCLEAEELLGSSTFSAAVVDHGLRDGESTPLCARLDALGVPFVLYTGYEDVGECWSKGVHLPKPASHDVLLATVVSLFDHTAP
jgi:CheY-like chemotaxis protein